MKRRTTCESCNAPILWAQLEPKMTWAPIDVEPVEGGNIALRKVDGRVIGHVIKKDEEYNYPRRTNHFQTCPDAKKFKKKR